MSQLLLVIDYQRDFVDGALGFPGAELLDKPIAEKISAYRAAGDDVAFTLDTHGPDYLDTQEGRNLPILHCLHGSPGWELYGRTGAALDRTRDRIFCKPAFPALELGAWLKGQDYRRIEVVGLVSYLCVLSNAIMAKAALPEAEIVVDAACTGGPDPILHQKCLDLMQALQISVVHRGPA